MNYDWEIQYKNLEAKFNPELTPEPYVLYTLRVYGLNYKIYIKIPLIFQYDVQYVFQKIKNELIQYNFIDIDLAMKKLHKLYVKQNIDRFDKVEEIEYEHYLENQEPFITVYKSKPIRGIVLELQTLNPEFIERRKYE